MVSPAEAFDIQSDVMAARAAQVRTWVPLARVLYDFHTSKAWEALGCESFNEWLGQPEVSLGRSDAYAMIAAWRELVERRGIPQNRLETLDVSKVAVVLPAVKAGRVDVEQALADVAVLSRSDLRCEYQKDRSQVEYRLCEACGGKVALPMEGS